MKFTAILRSALAVPALALILAGCSGPMDPPGASGAPGKITFAIGGAERMARPSLDQFEKILLSFAGRDDAEDLNDTDITAGSVTVDIFVKGSWDVTARAYIDEEDEEPAAVSNTQVISWEGPGCEVSGESWFVLSPTAEETEPGTLRHTVTLPEGITLGAGSRIRIEQDGAVLEDLDDQSFTDGEKEITGPIEAADLSLAAGVYVVDILIVKNDTTVAACREAAEILPGLITEIVFAPESGGFLDPAASAAGVDAAGLTFEATEDDSSVSDIQYSDAPSPVLAIMAATDIQTVYFTLAKTAEQQVAVDGTDAASVVMVEEGDDAGDSTASDTLAVFVVSNVHQGEKEFFITVTETGREGGVVVAVTVSPEVAGRNFGLFSKAIDAEESAYERITGYPIESLADALAWLAVKDNLTDNTSYLVAIDADQEIPAWASYFHDTNVSDANQYAQQPKHIEITLRGIDMVGEKNWKVSWDGAGTPATSVHGLLTVQRETTLILDNGITLDGEDTQIGSGMAMIYLYFASSTRGTPPSLIMREGSKITGGYYLSTTYGTAVHINHNESSYTSEKSAFTMDGGEISGNEGYVIVCNNNGKFTMTNGATITGNTLTADSNTTSQIATSGHAVLSIGTGTFFFEDGEISDHNLRGVYVSGNNVGGTLTMTGGRIVRNGTGLRYGDAAVSGAGLYLADSKGSITGGEISGNGSEDSIGSAIQFNGDWNTFTLDGTVAIDGSMVYSNFGFEPGIALGSSFVNTCGPIVVYLGCIYSAIEVDALQKWNGFVSGNILLFIPDSELTLSDVVTLGGRGFYMGGAYGVLNEVDSATFAAAKFILKEDGTLGIDE
jgi:hypothetical protein